MRWLPLLALLCFSACIHEDTDDCYDYLINVRVIDTEGNDITESGIVSSVDIYMFDASGFVRMVPRGSSAEYLFRSSTPEPLTLIAWGNLKEDSLNIPNVSKGLMPEDIRLSLLNNESGNHLPSPDLYHTRRIVQPELATTRASATHTITLVLERCVAGVSVETRNYAGQFEDGRDPCHFIVRGLTHAMDFNAAPAGSRGAYRPDVYRDAVEDMFVDPFWMMPTQDDLSLQLDLCRGDEALQCFTEDSEGQTFQAVPGKILNIILDFDTSGAITISTEIIEPWEDGGSGGGTIT